MSFPSKWLTEPPPLPAPNSQPNTQERQFAAKLRELALEGSIAQVLLEWFYQYEQLFTPPSARIINKDDVPDSAPEAAPPAPPVPPPIPPQIADGVAEVLREISHSLRELRMGYTEILKTVGTQNKDAIDKIDVAYASALDKTNEGIDKLTSAQTKLTDAYGQLTDDHRSFLGMVFPHIGEMYKTSNESMLAYRQGILAEAKANTAVAAAQAQQGTGDALVDEGGKAIVGLLTEAVKKRMSGESSETKPEPKKEAPAPTAPAAPPAEPAK